MTGGTNRGRNINILLAKAANYYKLGMGLGSIRSYIEDESRFDDFNVRKHIGERPLFANIGIAQLEQYNNDKYTKLIDAINRLECDGLFVHINPLQEAAQPEGDKFTRTPAETLEKFLGHFSGRVVIKEVGQGFGPRSIKHLLELPISGIELAGFGGTNFTEIENERSGNMNLRPLSRLGHDNNEMIHYLNDNYSPVNSDKSIIVSGGLKNSLDGYFYTSQLKHKSMFAFASALLQHIESEETLYSFLDAQVKMLKIASNYLEVKR
jgi:isopentenyl-diphosphate delta-isomerase